MKKILFIILFSILVSLSGNTAEWKEIFEKKYVDFETITFNDYNGSLEFWEKSLRKDSKELFPLTNKPYWFSMNRWQFDCQNKKERITAIAVYDLKGKVIYSDEAMPEWNSIIPETYADGYYRLFCLIPFSENPLPKN